MVRELAELAGRPAAVLGGRPGRLAGATGHNGYAKTLIASASREKP
jgi:hypothetical protein